MTDHHMLVVTVESDGRRRYSVRCPGVTDHCRGWLECREPGCNAYEESDDEVHGVEHRWVEEVGYSTPTDECWLVGNSELREMARDALGAEAAAGEYPVKVVYADGVPELRRAGGAACE